MLLDPLDCILEESALGSESDASLDGSRWVMETAPDIVCFEPSHMVLAVSSTISMGVYTMLVLRLIRVSGDLKSVEFDPRRYVAVPLFAFILVRLR